jgi:hypothetical protein
MPNFSISSMARNASAGVIFDNSPSTAVEFASNLGSYQNPLNFVQQSPKNVLSLIVGRPLFIVDRYPIIPSQSAPFPAQSFSFAFGEGVGKLT